MDKLKIKELETKVREYEEEMDKQKRINIRITNNYEYLDQLYDKVISLLSEEQIIELNKLLTNQQINE